MQAAKLFLQEVHFPAIYPQQLCEIAELRCGLHGHRIAASRLSESGHQAIVTRRMTPRFGLIGSPIARFMGGVSEE
jgi:hypothetical protein